MDADKNSSAITTSATKNQLSDTRGEISPTRDAESFDPSLEARISSSETDLGGGWLPEPESPDISGNDDDANTPTTVPSSPPPFFEDELLDMLDSVPVAAKPAAGARILSTVSHETPHGRQLRPSGLVSEDSRASGGCDARALHHLGVFQSEDDAKIALNAQIDQVWGALKIDQPDCPRGKAGLDDVEWCHDVVKKAVNAAGFHWTKVQRLIPCGKPTELSQLNLNWLMDDGEGGAFFVDGFLNTSYSRIHPRGNKRVKMPALADTDKGNKSRHSIAVIRKKVHDHKKFILGGSMSVDCLWLNRSSKPDPQKGYLSEVLRAYRVDKCMGSSGCKGLMSAVPGKVGGCFHRRHK
jgi:hypothetical protein